MATADRTPALFIAHGNPMNALGGTPLAEFLAGWGRALPRPRAALVISAHWEHMGLAVTSAAQPATIHDFYGFPPELFAVRYPAPGDPALAREVVALLAAAGLDAAEDPARGLDHGVWSPLRMLWPEADVPLVQLALRRGAAGRDHLEAGRALAPLRERGVLIAGSGNLVHSLREADFGRRDAPPLAWATAFDAWVRDRLLAGDADALARFDELGPGARRAHPTPEHYLPLLVALGAAPGARVAFPYEGFEHACLSLRCVRFD